MRWLLRLVEASVAASGTGAHSSVVSGGGRLDRASRTMTYRSRSGAAYFRFEFARVGRDVRIYIIEYPNRHMGSCHVLRDGVGPYICWSQPVSTMPEAEAVAAMWAEATLIYQRTGRTF